MKVRITLVALGVLSTLLVNAQDLAQGLVGHYPLNGSAADISGNNYDGTLVNGSPINDRFGVSGEALGFSSTDPGSLTIASNADFESNSFSISIWDLNLPSSPGGGFFYKKENTISIFKTNPGSNRREYTVLFFTSPEVSEQIRFSTFSQLPVNLVATYDDATKTGSVYIDDVLQGQVVLSPEININNNDIVIGDATTINLDEVRIYNRAISESEVSLLYQDDFLPDFSISNSVRAGQAAQFTDQSISSAMITNWQWDFDNNGSVDAVVQNPSFVYNSPGIEDVALTISDGTRSRRIVKQAFAAVQVGNVALDITNAEYYFDSDPGVGSGMAIAVSPNDTLQLTAEIEIAGLTTGFHKLFIRFRDDIGRWSLAEGRDFYVQSVSQSMGSSNIVAAEYYIDDDPGFGLGIPISVMSADTARLMLEIGSLSLEEGQHTLGIRVQDDLRQWSTVTTETFFIDDTAPNITSPATFEIQENSIGLYSAFSTETVTYTLGNSKDESLFQFLSQTQFGFTTEPDFENPLDTNEDNNYLVDLIATDAAGNSSTLEITITVIDVDENTAPIISDQMFSIDENSEAGTLVGSVVATDSEGGDLTYVITTGNANDAFALESSSGSLTVADMAQLDFETTPSFSLTVEVSDSELSSTAIVTVTLNDLNENTAPMISDQMFSIDENSESGTLVGSVVATDAEGDDLTYVITAGNTNGAFALESGTGSLTVADMAQLDFETTPSFSLTVVVSDSELSSTATVTVTLNDLNENTAPMISDQMFSIDENSAIGTLVGSVVATDVESDALTYIITAGNTNNAFALESSTGSLTVADMAALDFETTPSFSLTVEVSDGDLFAAATVTVTLNDLNENTAPIISDQVFSIDENSEAGALVGSVIATDGEEDALTYTITAGNTNNAFALESSTGSLTVADMTALDFETTPSFSLTVEVSDGELSAAATVTVTLNDLTENTAPMISDQMFSIDENSETGTLVGSVIATDGEEDALTYTITAGNTNNAFVLESSTGSLTVADKTELDFETTPSFSLTVEVSDGVLSSTAIITVTLNDLNENTAPMISDQTFSIDENSEVGTLVGSVIATDGEEDDLTYTITAGNTNNAFALESNTGELTVADMTALDFETTPSFSLTVEVSDGELSSTATITVTLNDLNENTAPMISDQMFSIDENSEVGTLVGSVIATDGEGDVLTYTITAGNMDNAFSLESSTGSMTVADMTPLDFETTPSFSLTIEVSDGELSSMATVTVALNDLDDEVLGLSEVSNISLHPNPVTNRFTLSNVYVTIGTIKLVSLVGGMVRRLSPVAENSYDITDLEEGVYLVVVEGEKGTVMVGRIIKE